MSGQPMGTSPFGMAPGGQLYGAWPPFGMGGMPYGKGRMPWDKGVMPWDKGGWPLDKDGFGKGYGKGGWGKGKSPWWRPTPGGGFAKQYPPGQVGIPYGFYPGYGWVQ